MFLYPNIRKFRLRYFWLDSGICPLIESGAPYRKFRVEIRHFPSVHLDDECIIELNNISDDITRSM